jgi:hypothetical protein
MITVGSAWRFDRERLLSALTSELADSARIMAKPVQYVRALNPDSLPSEPLTDLSTEAFHAAVDDNSEKNADPLLFTKV